MASPLSVLAAGVSAGSPATAKISTNTRVKTAAGPIGILPDILQFPGPAVTGNWVVGCTRVKIMGLPAISQAATGTSVTAAATPGPPMLVTLGDARVGGL